MTESLENQTATSEVLNVISRSPTELEPVLEAIVETASRLCQAGNIYLWKLKDGKYHPTAYKTDEPTFLQYLMDNPIEPDQRGSVTARAARQQRTIHVPDAFADLRRPGRDRPSRTRGSLKARNSELRVALEQQTATSELLKVIGRSTFELQPVFDALAENAVKLCSAERAFILRYDGHVLRGAASYNASPELVSFIQQNPVVPARHTVTGRAALERRTIHIQNA